MDALYFEDVEIGGSRKAGPYRVMKGELVEFAKRYDPQPMHLDEEAASRSVFGELSAPSALVYAIFTLLVTQLQPNYVRLLAGLGLDEFRMPNAVRAGDELDLEVTFLEKRASQSKPDRGIVRIQNVLRNQRRETVWQAISTVLVQRRQLEDASAAN